MTDIKHTIDNIQEICERPECYDVPNEIFDTFYELADYIKNSKLNNNSIANEIKDTIEKKRLDLGMCPKCSSDLATTEVELNTGEAWGKPYSENGYKKYCPTCGWLEED